MESENQKNVTLHSTTKKDTVSDNNSKLAVHDNGTPPVITTIHSDHEEINTETDISIETEKDLGVIYISDHEYDSDYEYRRKTNRPGPKSKTRYKLSQDEKEKARARYGNKRPRLDIESADSEKEDTNNDNSSIKDDSSDNNSSDFIAGGKVHDGKDNNSNDQLSICEIDISSVEDSNQMDESENKEEGTFTPKGTENDEVKINSKENSVNEDLSVTVAEDEKPEDVDKKDSKPHVHMTEENGTLKTTCQENCDEKEENSISFGTDIDPKEILDESIVEKDDTVMPLIEDNKITNADSLDNNADKEVILDTDIRPEADLQKSAIVEEGPKNIS